MFHRNFPELTVSASTIERVYKAHKVGYKFIRSVKKHFDYREPAFFNLLTDCNDNVIKARAKGLEILCLDEAVFTFNTFKKKAWSAKFQNLRVSEESRRMKCQALIAAISYERGLVSYEVHKGSIEGTKFLSFLEDLRSAMGE